MNFEFQRNILSELNKCAKSDIHSILLSGLSGCGKTYLSHHYGRILKVDDIISVEPTVEELQKAIQAGYETSNRMLFVIENLDAGVLKASYTILKFLEEPVSNVYIVVTCRNTYKIPNTILSRCSVFNIGHPTEEDIEEYGKGKDINKYQKYKKYSIWNTVKTFSNVESIFNLSLSQIEYFESFKNLLRCKDSVSNLIWNISHFPDKSEIDYELVFRYILCTTDNKHISDLCLKCMEDIDSANISPYTVLQKFVLDCKYGGY